MKRINELINNRLRNSDVWVTSDSHYGHPNIVKGVTNWPIDTPKQLRAVRDFPTVEKMNATIVNNINNHVKEDDWLIHIGDWSFGGFDNIEEFRNRIVCKNIILLIGNHDHHIENNRGDVQKMFRWIGHYLELRLKGDNRKLALNFVICHYPIVSWNGQRKGSMMLHGHQHLKGEDKFGQGKRIDAGLDGSPEFRPYKIEELVSLLKNRDALEHH